MIIHSTEQVMSTITCLISYDKGFIAGGDKGFIKFYEYIDKDSKRTFEDVSTVQIKSAENFCVRGLAVSPSVEDDLLIVTTENNQIYRASISSLLTRNPNAFEYLICEFHHGAIQCMDVAVKKPLLMTCGEDKTVRIWNYQTRTPEIVVKNTEKVISCSFHPSGFHILLGFQEKIQMYNVFSNLLNFYKDIPMKLIKEISFSNGGHLFAIIQLQTVYVYNFFTCDNPQNRAYMGGNVKLYSLSWHEEDDGFMASDYNGTVFDGVLKKPNLDPQCYQKGVVFTSLIKVNVDHNTSIMYAVGNDRSIKEILNANDNKKHDTGFSIGHIAYSPSQKLLFAGISDPDKTGALRCYKNLSFTEFTEIQVF